MHWTATPVVGVEEADLPQFSIVRYETTDRMEKLATGKMSSSSARTVTMF